MGRAYPTTERLGHERQGCQRPKLSRSSVLAWQRQIRRPFYENLRGELRRSWGASAVGTLVERTIRFLLLLHLPNDQSTKTVEAALRKAIKTLPKSLIQTITWDREANWLDTNSSATQPESSFSAIPTIPGNKRAITIPRASAPVCAQEH